jgi:hypothetical protein
MRDCVPQLPQACRRGPGHSWPVHAAFHWQLPPQVCVPDVPQSRVSFGGHSPSPEHSDQSDHSAVSASQLRVCVPQLPQLRARGPGQIMLRQPPH